MATANHTVVKATGEEATPYREQIKFLGNNRPYYGFISGSGAGKTFAGVYRLWLNATLWNPNEMGAIIVPDKSQFTDNIKPIMEDFGLMDRWEYKSVYTDEPGLVTDNGQRILILSADNERQIGRIKGKNLAYIWMDEEAEIPPRAREIADQRLRVGEYPNLFITTTPDGYNHTYDFFVGDVHDAESQSYGRGRIVFNDDKLAVIGVPSEANPTIDDEHIERMRRNTPEAIVRQELDGEFVKVGSGVFKREMLHFVKPDDLPNRDLNYQLAVDVGVEADAVKANERDSDYWAITALATDPLSPQAYVIDCHRKRGMSLKQGVSWIKSVAASMPPNVPIYVESVQAQRWLQQELSDQGLRAIPVNNTDKKEDRLIQLSIPLERGTVKFLNKPPSNATQDEFDEWKRFYESNGYAPRWEDMIRELMSFPDGSHDDLIDSLEIAVDNADIGGAAQSFMGGDYQERAESEW